jgi:bla regulator protein blaR1
MLMMRGRGHIESVGTGMSGLVRLLSGQLGRTVVDKTGLTGDFDYKLDWTPDDTASAMTKSSNPGPGDNTTSQDAAGPSLFTALEEQLGLKLESTKGPVDVIVIDQLEQPTAN